MKKMSKLLLVSIFAILLTTGCGNDKKEEKKNEEKSPEVSENAIQVQNPEIFTFKEKSLEYKNGVSTLEVNVTNVTNEDVHLYSLTINFFDDKGEKISTSRKLVDNTIKAKETKIITVTSKNDLTKATKIDYEIIG